MKTLAQQVEFYQAYHRTLGCKVTHVFGVPLVTFSLLIPMGWLKVFISEWHVSLAPVFVLCTLVYYFFLSPLLASLMAAIMIPLTYFADCISSLPFHVSAIVFAGVFVLGVAFQLVGHAIEGKRPALIDNFFQAVFTAPLFLLVEGLMALGWKGLATKP